MEEDNVLKKDELGHELEKIKEEFQKELDEERNNLKKQRTDLERQVEVLKEREKTFEELAKSRKRDAEALRNGNEESMHTQAILAKAEKELTIAVAKLEAEKSDLMEEKQRFERDQKKL